MIRNFKAELSLAVLIAVGILLNVAAALYVSVAWRPQQDVLFALGQSLVRSVPFIIPAAFAFFWKPIARYHWTILCAVVGALIVFAAWRYVNIIIIQGDRKAIFLFDGVHLCQWIITMVGLVLYTAARLYARTDRDSHSANAGPAPSSPHGHFAGRR